MILQLKTLAFANGRYIRGNTELTKRNRFGTRKWYQVLVK